MILDLTIRGSSMGGVNADACKGSDITMNRQHTIIAESRADKSFFDLIFILIYLQI